MSNTYTTRAGDTADSIAWAYYGTTGGRVVEQILVANPGLADLGASLPAGLDVELPDIDTTVKVQGTRLWD